MQNGIYEGRPWRILLATLIIVLISILIVHSEDSVAYSTRDVDFVDGEMRSASVQPGPFNNYWKRELDNETSGSSFMVSGTFMGYMSVPISSFDARTYVDSASIHFYAIQWQRPLENLSIVLMKEDPRFLGPETIWFSMKDNYDLGIVIPRFAIIDEYTIDISGNALTYLNDLITSDAQYVAIGFYSSGFYGEVLLRYGTDNSYLSFVYDDEAPDVPPPTAIDYSTGDHVPVTWSPTSDNPSGGNRGAVSYQVGVYLPGAPADNPYHTSPWVNDTSWNLTGVVDDITYTFRVRARDGSGFASNWSAPVNTTVDNSPPSVPVMYPEPQFSGGRKNTIAWQPSIDLGIGNVTYEYEWSTYVSFIVATLNDTDGTTVTISLARDEKYYYRVRAVDGFDHRSDWSLLEHSIQDSSHPLKPEVIEEPEYTSGNWNTFSWYPTMDVGIGVEFYEYEVANSSTFDLDSIVFSFHTMATYSWIPIDLEDGVRYYYRVRAVDFFGFTSEWSWPVNSTQDASPPSKPIVHPVPEFVPGGPLTVSWDPAIDRGVGVSHYELWYYMWGTPGSSPMVHTVEVIGQSITLPKLGGGYWNFGVMAVDRFGQVGPVTLFNTTVDATPPTQPMIRHIPRYSRTAEQTINWSPSVDEGSGVDYYIVEFSQAPGDGVIQYVKTLETEVTIVDLMEGVLYWFQVRAFDGVGNSNDGNDVHVIIDLTPPPAPELRPLNELGSRDWIELQWNPVIDNNGSYVEYQVRGIRYDLSQSTYTDIEYPWTTGTNLTIEGMHDLEFYRMHVVSRDPLGWVSDPSNVVSFSVDLTPPVVSIRTPIEGQTISGSIMIHAEVDDVNPWGYYMQYARDGGPRDWKYIVYWTEMGNPPWFFAQWNTAGLPDGDYVIRVTHIDDIGHQGYSEVNVTLINAKPRVAPSDITFSDVSPEKGDMVTVFVTVRNSGDSTAYTLMVELFDDGVLVGSFPDVRVKAHSFIELPFEVHVEDKHEFTVRVSSLFLYEPEETHRPRILIAQEVESGSIQVSSPVAWVGMIAIVLSVIAIALTLVGRRTAGAEASKGGDEILWVETEDGEEKDAG